MKPRPDSIIRRMARALSLSLACWCIPLLAQAQSAGPSAASSAFAQGQALQVAGDHAGAAEAFELADRIMPAPAAVRAAIANRMAAGHNARAASLALAALMRYPEDAETRTLASTTLNELGPKLTRVAVRCSEPCSISVSGQVVVPEPAPSSSFYLVPGVQSLEVRFADQSTLSHRIETREGEAIERAFSPERRAESVAPAALPAPAPSAPAPVATAQAVESSAPAPSDDGGRDSNSNGKVRPAYFWAGVGLTTVATALSVWSGLDTLAGVDAYEEAPTKARYESGHDKEVRTNALIATSAALGIATTVLGVFFTDFRGDHSANLSVTKNTAQADLTLRF